MIATDFQFSGPIAAREYTSHMANNYGTLGRRQQSAGWQWFAFGFIMGIILFGCIVASFFGAVAFGAVEVPGVSIGPSPQPALQIITATPQPATATPLATDTPQPTATTEAAAAEVVLPDPTTVGLNIDSPPTGGDTQPTPDGAVVVASTPTVVTQLDPSTVAGGDEPTPGLGAPSTSGLGASGSDTSTVDSGIPAVLDLLKTDTIDIPGGSFQMGTTITEAAEAVRECQDVFGGNCLLSYTEDSAPAREVQVSPFQIERTEVTYEQYIAFLNFLGPQSHASGCGGGQPC
ncbi:MAG: SUMF1/EgtB/PvdO family nonheme iron enzyme, partial [Chloroflexota bacterium]